MGYKFQMAKNASATEPTVNNAGQGIIGYIVKDGGEPVPMKLENIAAAVAATADAYSPGSYQEFKNTVPIKGVEDGEPHAAGALTLYFDEETGMYVYKVEATGDVFTKKLVGLTFANGTAIGGRRRRHRSKKARKGRKSRKSKKSQN